MRGGYDLVLGHIPPPPQSLISLCAQLCYKHFFCILWLSDHGLIFFDIFRKMNKEEPAPDGAVRVSDGQEVKCCLVLCCMFDVCHRVVEVCQCICDALSCLSCLC